jgi:hypothetical protein
MRTNNVRACGVREVAQAKSSSRRARGRTAQGCFEGAPACRLRAFLGSWTPADIPMSSGRTRSDWWGRSGGQGYRPCTGERSHNARRSMHNCRRRHQQGRLCSEDCGWLARRRWARTCSSAWVVSAQLCSYSGVPWLVRCSCDWAFQCSAQGMCASARACVRTYVGAYVGAVGTCSVSRCRLVPIIVCVARDALRLTGRHSAWS